VAVGQEGQENFEESATRIILMGKLDAAGDDIEL
jgi:hypothetical protein